MVLVLTLAAKCLRRRKSVTSLCEAAEHHVAADKPRVTGRSSPEHLLTRLAAERETLTSASHLRRAILRLMRPIDALYENGLLRPVSPLPLRSGERVALIVVRRPDSKRWDLARLVAHGDDDLALAEAGLEEWAAALDREDRG